MGSVHPIRQMNSMGYTNMFCTCKVEGTFSIGLCRESQRSFGVLIVGPSPSTTKRSFGIRPSVFFETRMGRIYSLHLDVVQILKVFTNGNTYANDAVSSTMRSRQRCGLIQDVEYSSGRWTNTPSKDPNATSRSISRINQSLVEGSRYGILIPVFDLVGHRSGILNFDDFKDFSALVNQPLIWLRPLN